MSSRLARFFNPPTEGYRAPVRVFWVALVVRLLYMTLAHQYRVKTFDSNFLFGYEAGRIAQALATGFGYADPFGNAFIRHTGPTAWLPPVYPLLLGGVFKVFGVYTRMSAWVILGINCVFSAWTAMAVWEMGARLANRRVALWSGWLWALYPAAMQYAVKWIWEMSITTALFAWVVVLAMRMRADPAVRPVRRWAWFGLIWALIGLSNSSLLIYLPVCGLWLLWGVYKDAPMLLRKWVAGAVLSGVVFVAAIAPWTLRNWEVFHAFIPMRGNFGVELYLGNGPGSNGILMESNHPYESPAQLRLYATMGEVEYVKMRGALAKKFIADHPMNFVHNTAMRIYYFWVSVPHPMDEAWYNEWGRTTNFFFLSLAGLMGLALALKRRLPGAGLWAWAFLLLPIPYYAVTVHARFRHPLEPMICVLGVYLFQSAELRRSANESGAIDQVAATRLTK